MNDFARKQVQTGDLPDGTYLDMALWRIVERIWSENRAKALLSKGANADADFSGGSVAGLR